MRGIVNKADLINKRVQENISPQLYLFCNIEKERDCWISEDGKYLHNILQLYKVMIDTNYITEHAKTLLAGDNFEEWRRIKSQIRYDELEKVTNYVRCFRSVEAHNIHEGNGYCENLEFIEYNNWVFSVIHQKPSTQVHYKQLNEKLEDLSEQLENCIIVFLDYIENANNKEEIIKRWEKLIINKYIQKEDFLYGQMGNLYFPLYADKKRKNVPKNVSKSQMRYIIKNWIRNYYLQPYEKAIKEIEDECNRRKKMVKSIEGKEALQRQAKEKIDKLQEKKDKEIITPICKYMNIDDMDEIKIEDYSKYFLQKTLPILINKIIQVNPDITLFPQDILQRLIREYMAVVDFD